MKVLSTTTSQALLLAFLALTPPSSITRILAQDAPAVTVTCEQETYALCAYANCTMNADLKTANCPCYSLSGPSVAIIGVIPDAAIQQATIEACSKEPTTCATTENDGVAPICQAIADQALWGADAVSTFSMALQEENGVAVDENGTRNDSMPTWSCRGVEGRLVPNCMLAPCRTLATPVTNNPYFDGEATMECVCPLLKANVNYTNFGGLQNPCEDSLVPEEGGYVQNTGGPVFVQHVMDPAVVAAAWEAVRTEFNKGGGGNGSEVESDTGSGGSEGDTSTGSNSSSGSTMANLALLCVVALVAFLL